MQSFIISVNAILPIFIIMFLGVALRKTGLLPEAVAQSLNKLTFKLLLPLSLFKSISASDFRAAVDSRFLLGCVGLILLVFATAWVLVSLCVKANARRGALIHGTFRSNYIILGMPVVEAGRLLTSYGLVMEIEGSGLAVSQSPAAQEEALPSTVVTVVFEPP